MRRPRALVLLPAVAALALAACGSSGGEAPSPAGAAGTASSGQGPRGELTVFAAASLHEAFEELGHQVEADHPGVTVSFSFAGSSDLVSQVLAGAPADVLATANEATMRQAVDGGAVAGEPVVFAENVLTLVVPPGNPAVVTGLDASLDRAKLVVCAPQVPCGAATAELARLEGVQLHPVSEESSVTDVLGKVSSGQADAGLVYTTDATGAGQAVQVVNVPGADQVVNRYPVAALAESRHPELARLWVDTLTGDAGRTVLADAGFRLP
ncbi:molybdate ABC transporter substrate-binding protein [Georgenia thermotolerans]|uniref:Molybdate ABC transporter substrate-binding protein n=1 Tax=Georgenia thermotolerans TaxID=527326 RepID=A0A7J5ULP4_9MICO|nr:molybdate ABC transporter substrate-binding protein [Georgenia thermotolerans]KAE8762813.1 molybdate ABC transporter substrate-binding protein [Georgenia thermotolerans]